MKKKPTRKKKPTAALARIEKAPLMQQSASAAPSIERTVERIEQVRRFVARGLNVGLQQLLKKNPRLPADDKRRTDLMIDYGTIPGVHKNFLLQPGAEKICLWLNVRPTYETIERELPEGHLEVIAKCKLLSKADGMEVFSGPSCSCSSMEVKFRYRFAKRDVQTEQLPDKKEADRLKAAGLGKWIKNKFAKSGENPWEWFDRIENRDIADTRNNVRQMAHKRALVKVVRNFGAMSEIFTEDPTEWNFADTGDVPDDAQEVIQRTPGGREIVIEGSEGTQEAANAVAERKKAEYEQRKPQTQSKPTKPTEVKKPSQTPPVEFRAPSSVSTEQSGDFMRVVISHADVGALFLLEVQMDDQVRGLTLASTATRILEVGAQMHPTIPWAFLVKDEKFDAMVAMLKNRDFEVRHLPAPKPTPEGTPPRANIPPHVPPQPAGLITKLRKTNSGKPFAIVTWNGLDIAIWKQGETYEEIDRAFKGKKSVVISYREKPNTDPSKPPYRDVVSFELAALQQNDR